jgi:hypothetical protein
MAATSRKPNRRQGERPVSQSLPGPPSGEVDLLFALVRERYGSRLTPEELAAVRSGVAAIVEGARALRAVRLDNGDAPLLPRSPDPPAP